MSVVKQQDESATAPVSVTGFDHEKEGQSACSFFDLTLTITKKTVNLMRALKVVSDNLPEVKEWLLNTNVKVERKRALAFHLRTIQRFVQKIKEMNEICGPIEAKGISSVAADIDPEDGSLSLPTHTGIL
jgi:hypothetical protein